MQCFNTDNQFYALHNKTNKLIYFKGMRRKEKGTEHPYFNFSGLRRAMVKSVIKSQISKYRSTHMTYVIHI